MGAGGMSNSGDRRSFNIGDVKGLVYGVVHNWEISTRVEIMAEGGRPVGRAEVEVSTEARDVLTATVQFNWDHIQQVLAEGKPDEHNLLQNGLEEVLQRSLILAFEQMRKKFPDPWQAFPEEASPKVIKIEADTVGEVIKTRCPYLFWC